MDSFFLISYLEFLIKFVNTSNFVTNGLKQETLHMKICVHLHYIIAALFKQDMPLFFVGYELFVYLHVYEISIMINCISVTEIKV